jgi:lipopolysaccharide/colanic/teichoic acid biosynthesis glycosyltransferase
MSGYPAYQVTKRLIDVVLASIGLLVLLPVFAGVAAAIKLGSRGPILYGSTRIGRDRIPFRMWKFRTMVPGADRLGGSVTTDGDPRITRIGHMLRRSKLDELPNLWNVLVGHMTLVGPRPETPTWVDRYTPEMARVLNARPGITDIAQIVFRHEERMLKGVAVDEAQYVTVMRWKVALQAEYLRRRSLLIDFRVLKYTLAAILDSRSDSELERLVACASNFTDGGLPPLVWQRAEHILGSGPTHLVAETWEPNQPSSKLH